MRGEDVSVPAPRSCNAGSPRVRGEDQAFATGASITGGSPPHARGRRRADLLVGRYAGITPACAGKTSWPSAASSRKRDHPRMHGEDEKFCFGSPCSCGSPPHARGRPPGKIGKLRRCRITPACAGKTCRTPSRMRAESGSPPHARGRPRSTTSPSCLPGITPACAGKTSTDPSPTASRADHPRMRGEDILGTTGSGKSQGSPPHARGRLQRKTSSRRTGTDHPRMRGEDSSRALRS